MKKELFALERADLTQPGKNSPSLVNVNLHVYEREILAVTCDTISQKNAFVDAMCGECAINGAIRLFHQTIQRSQAINSFRQHFSVIKGDNCLLPTLSVAENICPSFLSSLFIPHKAILRQAGQLTARFGVQLNLNACPADLTSKEAVIVAILQAYMRQKKMIVLVDLSQYLSSDDLSEIYEIISLLKQEGLSFIIIDLLNPYLVKWADNFLLIKNNTVLACFESSFIDYEKIRLYLLSGKADRNDNKRSLQEYQSAEPVFSLMHLYTHDLTDISFQMYPGELMKLFSFDQYSFDGLYKLLSGQAPIYSGTARLSGKKTSFSSASHFRKRDIFWCPESPYINLLVDNLSVRDNLLSVLSSKSGKVHLNPSFISHVDQFIRDNLAISDPSTSVAEFPIPKRQEIALAKIILLAPDVVFFYRPFLETDLCTKNITISVIKKLQSRGCCVIILTSSVSDLRELDGKLICLKHGKEAPDSEFSLNMTDTPKYAVRNVGNIQDSASQL